MNAISTAWSIICHYFEIRIKMRQLKAVIFGLQETGKTELFSKLFYADHLAPNSYRATIAPDFNNLIIKKENPEESTKIMVWEFPGVPRYRILSEPFLKGADIGLYCIDLSKEITDKDIEEGKSYIKNFIECNPDALLMLTGTKHDLALPNALETAINKFKFAEIPFDTFISTSSKDVNGLSDLHAFFAEQANKLALEDKNAEINVHKEENPCIKDSESPLPIVLAPATIAALNQTADKKAWEKQNLKLNNLFWASNYHPKVSLVPSLADKVNKQTPELTLALFYPDLQQANKDALEKQGIKINSLFWARNRCLKGSELYMALDYLMNQVKDLPIPVSDSLGFEANLLINNLLNPLIVDKTPAINAFIEQSNHHLQDKYQWVKSSILAVAISAALVLVAAMIGFGIGFAIGSWTGPGAMVTGFVTGSAVGLGALAYATHRFMSPPPAAESVDSDNDKTSANIPLN